MNILGNMNISHLAWINDKNSPSKATPYRQIQAQAQARLRAMKEAWCSDRATEIQQASDQKDAKRFYDGVKAVYGNQSSGAAPLMNADGTTRFTDRSEILKRWAAHFNDVLSQPSFISLAALDEATQHPIIHELEARLNIAETTQAIKKLTSGKAACSDAITPEIYKHGGINLTKRLVKLFTIIWDSRSIPPDFKDALLVHIYKRNGGRTICDNHRGVSLLCIAGKILAWIMLNRLAQHTADNVLPESQCGFQTGRRTPLAKAARRFGLTISLKKTEVMFQSKPDTNHVPPNITINNVTLNVVDKLSVWEVRCPKMQ